MVVGKITKKAEVVHDKHRAAADEMVRALKY